MKQKGLDVKYYTDKDAGVTVCIISVDPFKTADRINRYVLANGLSASCLTKIPEHFRGKAKCSPQDEFNEEAGKKIAFDRAFRKYAKANNRLVRDFVKRLSDTAELLDKYGRISEV